ncbi:MAG: protein kinase, partial [Blastochloris sp.]|nr:protein kinase [Blastochloris sp.]
MESGLPQQSSESPQPGSVPPPRTSRFNTRKLRVTTGKVDVDFINTGGIPSYQFQPGAGFSHYKILQAQDLTAHDAETWLAEDTVTGKVVIIRVYRRGIRPRLEIMDTLRLMKGRGVSEIFEVGELQGLHYEVLERVSFGSLADRLQSQPLKETDIRQLVSDLCAVIRNLHQFGLLHQDISPRNIFQRSNNPPDFILGNFSLAVLGEQSTPDSVKKRDRSNTAPEALSGPPTKASDWWSLGMVVFEALMGQHPFHGLSETDLMFKIVSQDVKIPDSIPADWSVLLKGLLIRDPVRRWQEMEVENWLKDSRQLTQTQNLHASQQVTSFSYNPILFLGNSYSELHVLAQALSNHWDSAISLLQSGSLETWFKTEVYDPDKQHHFDRLIQDSKLSIEQKLMVVLLLFSPSMPLSYKGSLVHIEWLSEHPIFSRSFFESTLPQWVYLLSKEPAFVEWQEFREELHSQIHSFDVRCDTLLLERYTLTEATELNRLHADFCRRFVSSDNPQLAEILSRKQADLAETVLLLSAEKDQFLTQEQMLSRQHHEEMDAFQRYLRAFDLPMHLDQTQELLSLQPEAKLQEKFRARHTLFSGSSHPMLNRIHHKDSPAAVEMIAYLITPESFFDPAPKEERGLARVLGGIKRLSRKERNNSVEPVSHIKLPPLTGHVLGLHFSPDNKELIVHLDQGRILGFSTMDGQLLHTYQESGDPLEFIVVSPGGSYIAAVARGIDHRIHLWDRTGQRGKFFLEGNLNEIHSVAFSRDDQLLFAGGIERLVRSWDLASGQPAHKYEGNTYTITRLANHPLSPPPLLRQCQRRGPGL